jgi:hypothetical protein
MACFHPVASVVLGYILGYVNLYIGPPEILFQILVHLCTAGMNRKFGFVSLIEDDLLNLRINGDHKEFSKLDHILVIFLETGILGVFLC